MTAQKQYQTFEVGRVREILTELGYSPLHQNGKYYRTRAIYRGGDNPTSLSIHSESGWCKDFVEQRSFPLVQLVSRTLKTTDPKILARFVSGELRPSSKPKIPKEKMPTTYPDKILEKLLPNFFFYEERKISPQTVKEYQAGLATEGKMYQRLVFPVRNEYGQIFGFSGRKINEERDAPKWKHLGLKNQWVYPYYSVKGCRETLDESDEAIIVESIGDSLALSECGIKNHLVNFGLDCSTALQSFLLAKDPQSVIIAPNSDLEKKENWGKIAAIKTMMKIMNILPIERIKIKLPTLNDLSDMHKAGQNLNDWLKSDNYLSRQEILDFANENANHFANDKLTKLNKKLK